MAVILKDFAEAQSKSVDKDLPVGGWRVHPQYKLREYAVDGVLYDTYVEASPIGWIEHPTDGPVTGFSMPEPEEAGERVYAPLHGTPLLCLEFSKLFEERPTHEAAVEAALDWAKHYGTLGIHTQYLTPEGEMEIDRFDDRESVRSFTRLAVEAGRCLRLFEAAKGRNGPDVDRLRKMGVKGETPRQLADRALHRVDEIVGKHLESETYLRRYRKNGTMSRGPGFHSLLGAMYLQMSNLVDAPEETITYCKWCGDVITFEDGEPPPSDAPKGTPGKHKTHFHRQFCKQKNGVKDYCKNRSNYEKRKARR